MTEEQANPDRGEVLITIHRGADCYGECFLCGEHVYYKRNQPVLYSAQPDLLAWVCRDCATRDDPEVVELFDRLTTPSKRGEV